MNLVILLIEVSPLSLRHSYCACLEMGLELARIFWIARTSVAVAPFRFHPTADHGDFGLLPSIQFQISLLENVKFSLPR